LVQACRKSANGAADTKDGEEGIVINRNGQPGKIASEFIKAIAQHRHWSREKKVQAAD